MRARICHYCNGRGNTKDHIVARCYYKSNVVPQTLLEMNKVPACQRCNGLKGNRRTDCECTLCETAWTVMGPYIQLPEKRKIPVFPLLAYLRELSEETG